jgi:hypothetical protein
LNAMQPLKAHVRNGRLVLDEPTDLPEGEVVELVPRGDVLDTANRNVPASDPVALALDGAPTGAPLSAEERAALDEARADKRRPRSRAKIEAMLARSKSD